MKTTSQKKARLPVAVRRSVAGVTLGSTWDSIKQAAAANAFDDPDVAVTSTTLELDAEAYPTYVESFATRCARCWVSTPIASGVVETTRSTQLVLLHSDRA
jgi:hypothetical protein